MRRCAVGQSIEEETEAATKLLLAQPQRFEEPLLNILAVNADAAGAKFVAVQNKIVALRTHFPWCGFELVQVLIDNASERVLRADPGLFRLAPFEQRKAGDPEKPPLRLVGQIERFAELQTQLSRDERSGFRAFDLFLRGNTNNEVAGLCSASLAKFVYIFCTDHFLNRRRQALRRHFYEIRAACFQRFRFLGQVVELLARIARRARRRQREDAAFDLQLLLGLIRKAVRYFVEFHAEAQVGLVAAVFANHVFVQHVRKRGGHFDSRDGAGAHHDRFNDMKNIFLARERHLQVELREFRLAVGAQIFVAETLHDLKVSV